MGHTIRDIAAALGARAEGDLDLVILSASEPAMAGPDALALAMDPKYADVIVKRWQDFTGKNAVHEADGRTFNEIAGKEPAPVSSDCATA